MRNLIFRVWDNVDFMSSNFTLQDLQDKKIQFTEECIIMQATGLKDKNNIEILEGDILTHNKNTFFVRMSKNQHVLLLRDTNKISKSWRDLIWCANVCKYIEIIGNIYENPELL